MAAGSQSLEVLFGVPGGDQIRIEVLGMTCPEADTDWYRSQLNTTIHIQVESFVGRRSLVMFSDDFHRFRSKLSCLRLGETSAATLETSDILDVIVAMNGSVLNVRMQLDALDDEHGSPLLLDGGERNWEWRIAIDHGSLDALVDAVARISAHYPTWSVPRHRVIT